VRGLSGSACRCHGGLDSMRREDLPGRGLCGMRWHLRSCWCSHTSSHLRVVHRHLCLQAEARETPWA
jgi:hypothetical protein